MNVLLAILMFGIAFNSYAFDAEKYFKVNCSTCHSIGEGDKVGPDLAGLSKRRKVEWIVKFVSYPTGMIEGDPEEPGYEKADETAKKVFALYKPVSMNEFTDLDKTKVEAILKYIDSLAKKPQGKITTLK